ncbi:hypothetical protein [Streptomyces goshikiensis]|uniref:hypothetical protein n=1 Tax=Streptomyces goshikiensis TaxID=1942 RepID=UPI0036771EB8
MPRWLKVIAIVAAVLVALFVILLVTGGPGGHGPGRHMSKAGSGASGTYAPVVLMQAPVGGSLA